MPGQRSPFSKMKPDVTRRYPCRLDLPFSMCRPLRFNLSNVAGKGKPARKDARSSGSETGASLSGQGSTGFFWVIQG